MEVAHDAVMRKVPEPEPVPKYHFTPPPLEHDQISGDDGGPTFGATSSFVAEPFVHDYHDYVVFDPPITWTPLDIPDPRAFVDNLVPKLSEPEPTGVPVKPSVLPRWGVPVRSVMVTSCGMPCAPCDPPEWVLDALYGDDQEYSSARRRSAAPSERRSSSARRGRSRSDVDAFLRGRHQSRASGDGRGGDVHAFLDWGR